MCGRYDNLIPREAYVRLFGVNRLPDWNFPLRYNTAPTDPVPIVRIDPRDGVRELAIARWGLVPSGGRAIPKAPHINARCETVASNGLFRNAFAKRRALVPATGFYEWKAEGQLKQPWRFTLMGESPFALAGLWELLASTTGTLSPRQSSPRPQTRWSHRCTIACRSSCRGKTTTAGCRPRRPQETLPL
jgi:putative SOS response-associated peptidase YedK